MKSVQVRTSGSQDTFQSLTNKWGSDWETPNAPKFPLDINIVGADGESVRPACHARLCPMAGCACRLTAGPPSPKSICADQASS